MKRGEMATLVVCALILAGFVPSGPALATDYHNDGKTGDWSADATWTEPGSPSAAIDTAEISGGTVTTTVIDVPTIAGVVVTGGTLRLNVDQTGGNTCTVSGTGVLSHTYGSTRSTNWGIVLDGGRLDVPYRTWNLDGPIGVVADSIFGQDANYGHTGGPKVYVNGNITGSGKLDYDGYGRYSQINSSNPNYTGGWDINSGVIWVSGDMAMGTGPINVYSGAGLTWNVAQNYGGANPEQGLITYHPGTSFWPKANLTLDLTLDGATFELWDVTYGGTLTVGANGMTLFGGGSDAGRCLQFDGQLVGTVDITADCTGRGISMNNANPGYSGDWDVTSGRVYYNAVGCMGTGDITVSGGTIIFPQPMDLSGEKTFLIGSGGSMQINRSGGGYTVTVNATVNGGTVLGCESYGGGTPYTFAGTQTLTADSYYNCTDKSDARLEIAALVTESGGSFKVIRNAGYWNMPVIFSNPANDFSGGTDVRRGWVEIDAAGALGKGTVNLYGEDWFMASNKVWSTSAGMLRTRTGTAVLDGLPAINVPAEAVLDIGTDDELTDTKGSPAVTVSAGGSLMITGSPTTTFIYSGGDQNIIVYKGAILDTSLGANVPTRDEVLAFPGGGYGVYEGHASNYTVSAGTGVVFGDDGSTIYRGLAATAGGRLDFHGDASDPDANGVMFYSQAYSSVRLYSDATYSGAASLELNGRGSFDLYGSGSNLPAAINFDGHDGGQLTVRESGSLPAGKVLGVTGGQVTPAVADGIAGIVNLGNHGILYTDQALSSGTFNVGTGAGVRLFLNSALSSGAQFNWSDGSQLLLADDSIASKPTTGGVTFLLFSKDGNMWVQPGLFVLGPDSRLTCGGDGGGTLYSTNWVGLSSTSGDITSTGATARIACRSDVQYMRLDNKLDLSGKKLIVGDTSEFLAVSSQKGALVPISQDGSVWLYNTNNVIGSIEVQGGTLWVSGTGRDGGAASIDLFAGTTFHCNESTTLNAVITGAANTEAMNGPNSRRMYLTPTLTQDAGMYPGPKAAGAVGTMTHTGALQFEWLDDKHSRLGIEIIGHGGAAGVDHDQLVVQLAPGNQEGGTGVYNINRAKLELNLPLPSGLLNPNILNGSAKGDGVDMTVLTAPAVTGGGFAEVVIGPGTDDHWAVSQTFGEKTAAVEVVDGDVILHGQAISWNGFGGDADLNGVVNYLDLGVLATYYDQTGLGWDDGDFNFDGKVDYMDLGILATNYDLTEPSGGAPVPEPALVILLGAGVVGLLRRRRQR